MLRASLWPSKRLGRCRIPCLNNAGQPWQIISRRNYANEKSLKTKEVPAENNNSELAQNTTSTKGSDRSTIISPDFSSLNSSSLSRAGLPDSKESYQSPRVVPVQKPLGFFRKLVTFTVLFSVLGFSGGVYYSSINDNFHDFFTEYIPFGERAVLYLEELEYRKKFPAVSEVSPRDSNSITSIPRHSGVSWRIAEGSTGRHTDATKSDVNLPKPSPEKKKDLTNSSGKESIIPPVEEKTPHPQPLSVQNTSSISENVKASDSPEVAPFTVPEVDQPSRFPPESTRIDPIAINDGNEPLVQDLVKIINDIIVVVEADNSNGKFLSTIEKAKTQLSKVGSRILALKEEACKEADAKIQAGKDDFDRAAKELIRRLELEIQTQKADWQEEYQTEREKIHQNYENKLKLELERANELHEHRLRNALLEQSIEMRKEFGKEIQNRVEEERNGRLKNLSELSNTVADLEKLATNWNSVVDYNLKTQQLHVAVEATRMFLEKSEKPRPFLRELVALREIASDDPVVNAAIASINPIAYHQGIPSSAQIIDRFRRVATEVRKAALLPADAGVASHASSYVLSKLLFKKTGQAIGDNVESILTRAESYLEEGNLDLAAREINGLRGWAKTLSRDWLDEVRRVLEVRQALDVIATEARLKSLTVE
ncbi:MICOS complex subunit mic60 [Erysiphe necator]|nr:MICOS complex subunit mic60 [Erysiphe necator]